MRSGWLAAALFLTQQQPMFGQTELAMPGWLANYPDVTAQTTSANGQVEATYTTPAKPEVVIDHYRKLFEARNLPFMPNFDGMGTVVRGTAAECDLLISIRAQDPGTFVRVECAGKSSSSGTWRAIGESTTATRPATGARRLPPAAAAQQHREEYNRNVAEALERHKQLVKELGIHPVYQDAPAPPLVWPEWLVHLKGTRLATQQGVDQSHKSYLESKYVTTAPMSAIHVFYEDLLTANGYPVHSGSLGTGHTTSGIMQNADGHVEGINYPNGHPGPYTEIRVSYSRFYLNEPITVRLRFTTYAFKAPPPFGH